MPTATPPTPKPNAHAAHAARMAESKAKRDAAKAAAEALPPANDALFDDSDPPAEPADDLAPQQTTLVISTQVLHRGRLITIASEGRTLDQFCDLLDRRFGVAS